MPVQRSAPAYQGQNKRTYASQQQDNYKPGQAASGQLSLSQRANEAFAAQVLAVKLGMKEKSIAERFGLEQAWGEIPEEIGEKTPQRFQFSREKNHRNGR